MGLHFDRHHFISAAIEQLLPVGIPNRLGASLCRDLVFRTRSGVGSHVHFIPSRFVREIRQPISVRRKYRRPFAEWCLEEWPRLVIVKLKYPDIRTCEEIVLDKG